MRLLGRRNNAVSEIALRIVASMKRDWMQTCRKPSGLCGAALYLFALSHGFNFSKSDIVTVVHICKATLTKRLIEFEDTESGCLTDVQQTDLSSKLTSDSTGCAAPASKEPKLNGLSSVDTFACNDPEQDLHEEGTGNAESFSDIDDVEDDEAAFSICTVNFHDKEYGTLLAVGTAKGLHFLPKQSLTAGFIRIYGFIDEGKSQELLHKTQVKGVPLALCQFQGRLLADDSVPRWLTASHHLDFDTMAGADKFGNVYFVRLPQDVSDEIEEDPTGGKIKVGTREVEWCSQQGEGNC